MTVRVLSPPEGSDLTSLVWGLPPRHPPPSAWELGLGLCRSYAIHMALHLPAADLLPWLHGSSQDEDVNGDGWGPVGLGTLSAGFLPPTLLSPSGPGSAPPARWCTQGPDSTWVQWWEQRPDGILGFLPNTCYTSTRICVRLVVNCGLKC